MSSIILELGKYGDAIYDILRQSDNIKELLLGTGYQKAANDADETLKQYIFPHLYSSEAPVETQSYIFYDVYMPKVKIHTKDVEILIQAISHKSLAAYEKSGYYGARPAVLSEMIEEELIGKPMNSQKFGIGNLLLTEITALTGNTCFGKQLRFHTSEFR